MGAMSCKYFVLPLAAVNPVIAFHPSNPTHVLASVFRCTPVTSRAAGDILPHSGKDDGFEAAAVDTERQPDLVESAWAKRRRKRWEQTCALVTSIEAPPTGWPGGASAVLQDDLEVPLVHLLNTVNWSAIPEAVDPGRGGGLCRPSPKHWKRTLRKRTAVECMSQCVSDMLFDMDSGSDTPIVVDLCCGAGNLAVPISWLLQSKCRIVAVDVNSVSLGILQTRAASCDINITTVLGDVLAEGVMPKEDVAVVVALHACGAASDLAINAALASNSAFAVVPCCFGKLLAKRGHLPMDATLLLGGVQRAAAPDSVTYPRSKWLTHQLGSDAAAQHALLVKAADFAGADPAKLTPEVVKERWRVQRAARLILELDRLEFCREQGYDVELVAMPQVEMLGVANKAKNFKRDSNKDKPEYILIGRPGVLPLTQT